MSQDFQKKYFSIKPVYQPFFKEYIVFDKVGWFHLKRKNGGVKRTKEELKARGELLPLVAELLSKNFPPTEYSIRKINDKLEVEFYSFIYALRKENGEEFRIKIVLRQKSGEPKKFYSLIKMKHKHFQNEEAP